MQGTATLDSKVSFKEIGVKDSQSSLVVAHSDSVIIFLAFFISLVSAVAIYFLKRFVKSLEALISKHEQAIYGTVAGEDGIEHRLTVIETICKATNDKDSEWPIFRERRKRKR